MFKSIKGIIGITIPVIGLFLAFWSLNEQKQKSLIELLVRQWVQFKGLLASLWTYKFETTAFLIAVITAVFIARYILLIIEKYLKEIRSNKPILVDKQLETTIISNIVQGELPPVVALPEIHAMPYYSIEAGFIGRVEDLQILHEKLQRCKTTILTADSSSDASRKDKVALVCGMGGIGKSQLAVEYVHRLGYLYTGGVFWIDAEKSRTVMVNRICVAAGIQLDERLDEDGQVETLWKFLGDGEPVLVVLDNFSEKVEPGPWLPKGSAAQTSIHTLMTTRRKDLIDYESMSLDILSNQEGAKLINSRKRTFDEKKAGELSEKLGGLPLALELACYYLNRTATLSIDALIKDIDESEGKTLNKFADKYGDQLPTGHEKSIPAMFQMAWDSASENAKDILRAMSVLAPYPVPRRLLGKILFKEYTPENKNTLDEGLSKLAETLALTTLDHDSDPACHRLVIGFVQTTLEDNDFSKGVAHAVLDEMGRVTDVYDEDSYKELEKVVPHGVHVLETDLLEIVPKIDMASRIRWHYRKHGQLRLAEKYGQEALEIALDNLEQDHEKIAECMSNLATVLRVLGDLEGAREHLDKALESAINNFGLDHSDVAISRSNLALVLQDLGDLEVAREHLEKALESDINNFGLDHSNVAIDRSILAGVLQDLGDLEGAREHLDKALESDINNFGLDHSNVAIRRSNLAGVLKDLGDLEGAREHLDKALESDINDFGLDHSNVARCRTNLAMLLLDLGELEEAMELAEAAYSAMLNRYGPDLPITKSCKANLDALKADLASRA